jgi:hypothetical protein
MANSALTLTMLANIACAVGCDMGFNAVGVLRTYDLDSFQAKLKIYWGDAVTMRAHSSRGDCALAYANDERCIRAPRSLELPEEALYEPVYDLKARFVGALLELKMEEVPFQADRSESSNG